MALKDRISSLNPYLVAYNVSVEDGVQYAALRFPSNWSIPSKEIDEAYGVKVRKLEGGICFLAEIEKGADVLFDAIDYVVDLNEKMQERITLLKEKVEELKKLFMKEDLEKLKNIEFVFKSKKKNVKTGSKKEEVVSSQQAIEQAVEQTITETTEENEVMTEAENEPVDDGNDLVSFVENNIE